MGKLLCSRTCWKIKSFQTPELYRWDIFFQAGESRRNPAPCYRASLMPLLSFHSFPSAVLSQDTLAWAWHLVGQVQRDDAEHLKEKYPNFQVPRDSQGAAQSQWWGAHLQELARLHTPCCRAREFFSWALLLSLVFAQLAWHGKQWWFQLEQLLEFKMSVFSKSKYGKEWGKEIQPLGTRHWNHITTPKIQESVFQKQVNSFRKGLSHDLKCLYHPRSVTAWESLHELSWSHIQGKAAWLTHFSSISVSSKQEQFICFALFNFQIGCQLSGVYLSLSWMTECTRWALK